MVRFYRDERGHGLIEYTLFVLVITLVAFAAMNSARARACNTMLSAFESIVRSPQSTAKHLDPCDPTATSTSP